MNPADLFSHEPDTLNDTLNLAPGDTLFKTGDPGDAMFVLLEGAMDVMAGDKVVENSTRSAIIGEMALIDQSPRGATVLSANAPALRRLTSADFCISSSSTHSLPPMS
jgi:CRP-like cAMP-binding protein